VSEVAVLGTGVALISGNSGATFISSACFTSSIFGISQGFSTSGYFSAGLSFGFSFGFLSSFMKSMNA
jgi:hypothetical protein